MCVNKLIKVEETGKVKEEFTYDYMNRRVTEKLYLWVSGDWSLTVDLKRVYDGWNLIAVLNAGDDSLLKNYTWGEDLSGTLQGAGGVGGLLYETNSSGTYYSIYDGNGNITRYVDGAGVLKAFYEYGPTGKITCQYGSKANDFSFMFSTKEYDRNTEILFYQLRPLKVDITRWLSKDPLSEIVYDKETEKTSFNLLYGFVKNDPINIIDALGLSPFCVCVRADDDHAWIYVKDIATGIEHTYGRWKQGYGRPKVNKSGVVIDMELKRKHASERCIEVQSFTPTINEGYDLYNNNCASYAASEWRRISQESLSTSSFFTSLTYDLPSVLKESIIKKNGGKKNNDCACKEKQESKQ